MANITDSAISPSGDRLFYLVNEDGNSHGFVENVNSGAKIKLWSSVLNNISVSWLTENMIVLYTKPSSIAEGAVWTLNPKTGETSVILANHFALAAKTNNSGNRLLYSIQESQNSIFSLRVLNMKTAKVNTMRLSTLVEKCTWGPENSKYIYCAVPRDEISGNFLEEWYMGKTNSDDVLYRLDTEINIFKELLDPNEETGELFDIVDLVVSPDEDYLVFKTRVNNILWSLKLPEKIEIGEEEPLEETLD